MYNHLYLWIVLYINKENGSSSTEPATLPCHVFKVAQEKQIKNWL